MEHLLAGAAMMLVPVLLRVLPLRTALAVCDRWPAHRGPQLSADRLARRVAHWMRPRRGPWRQSCLTRSVVLYAILRQHGYRPRLHIGAAGTALRFVAHAWVTLAGRTLGEHEVPIPDFRPLLVHGD